MMSIKEFEMTVMGRMAPVAKWLSALIQLFSVEIEHVVTERDQKLAQLAKELGSRDIALNSRRHHVLTECNINLMSRLSESMLAVNS
jgi:hypothetical protein